MTQTGKCDTCRQRKVKCDEEKPKCGACRKKDRLCSYSYGKASAFIVQDPQQLTKHGKSRVAPVIHTFDASKEHVDSLVSTPSNLHVTTEREAENGQGFFQTLAPLSKRKATISRKAEAQRRRKLQLYLQQLQAESAIAAIKPLSPETTLIARYINMIGIKEAGYQPLSILGTWIQSIPSRVGSNRMMDLAVEFFVDSFSVYCNNSHTQRNLARASKEKALKELQLFVCNSQNRPTYDVLLATKMHYAAEALLGIDTMYHAIHSFGLAELLKSGAVANVDDEHFWNLIDNTYCDDVNEAMLAGRHSVYDNDFYLSSTYPPPLSLDATVVSATQRASMATMHVFIQCPRLNCLVRSAISDQDDTTALVEAITLAESLWHLNIPKQVAPLLNESVTKSTHPVNDLVDVMPESLHFDSVQTMVLCTRYWMLITILGGFIDTLYRYFPMETSLSNLPDRYITHKIETEAAECLIKSMPWSDALPQRLPLIPLRLHTPLQVSLGAWYRTIRRLSAVRASTPDLDANIDLEMVRTIKYAERMKRWILEECNKIHKRWDVSIVDEKPLFEALDTMAGEKIPDWLPVRVAFEAEDGEMVMKLDYENKEGTYRDYYDLSEEKPRTIHGKHTELWRKSAGLAFGDEIKDLPYRGILDQEPEQPKFRNTNMEPRDVANFVHSTGRNLCSTSGWWPTSEDETPTELPDRSRKSSPFSTVSTPKASSEYMMRHVDRHPCLASSFWPQTPNSIMVPLGGSTKNPCLSPAWSNPISRTSVFESSTGSLSPASASTRFTTPSACEQMSFTPE